MAEKTAEGANMSLKLMVHKKEQRVIFAEADSDFVDTLFSIMTLNLGTIVRVLEKSPDEEVHAVGRLKNLYHSVMNLSDNYFSAHYTKGMLLNPTGSSHDLCKKLKLNIHHTEPQNRDTGSGVFVTDVSTFIVTDDLHVKPNTDPGVCIQLLCDFGITDTSQLEEMVFSIDRDQILLLLKGAFLFKYPLSYMVFHNPSSAPSLDKSTSLGTVIKHSASIEAAAVSKNVTLKVTLRKSNSKFLFAVVDQDFADFLFGFLEIPLGTVIGKLMKGNSSFESLDNLYASISAMNLGYIKSQGVKDLVVKPQLKRDHVSQNSIFCLDALKFSQFSSGYIYEEHIMKSPATFMLTDDLSLSPVSSISTITELNKMKVPLNDVVEHELSIGFEEGVKLLKASLHSSSPLTDALLKGKF